MRIIVGVENFGKIKKAEIDISNFTIFVGNNNSGKSYMMQLIYGQLRQNGIDTFYIPNKFDNAVPLYLSSSMINELAPLVRALTDYTDYKYFLYDEIETCLHPEKQKQMARLLMRLNNAGKKFVVSTHSDNMAAQINNLLLLSFSEDNDKEEKLKKLNLTKEDLLKSSNIHIYQFSNQKDGTSIVEELEFRKLPYIGYNFDQFMNNAQRL